MNVGYCRNRAILVRSLPRFLVLSLPLSFPSTILPLSSTFDPRIYSCPTFPPTRAPSRTSSNKNVSRRTERAAPPRRCVPNAVPHARLTHTITLSPPPALALPATYVPPCPCPAQRYPGARSSRPSCTPSARPAPQAHAQRLRWRSLVLGARSFIRSPGPSLQSRHRCSTCVLGPSHYDPSLRRGLQHMRTASPSPTSPSPPRATATLLP
jgi:hypothetical protein